jgi:hypothetical protein
LTQVSTLSWALYTFSLHVIKIMLEICDQSTGEGISLFRSIKEENADIARTRSRLTFDLNWRIDSRRECSVIETSSV